MVFTYIKPQGHEQELVLWLISSLMFLGFLIMQTSSLENN
jgi:hypothetical protein